ncbi:MAG: hypothetical protein O8C66_01200 [Candidatus Methanoperedens sp.]|nr:hypothetical protein [Candidatus Methanoperedens sp.]MCZ7369104.1 hypothetical protein [Candidatus Methanoperedens sp.]
MLETPKERVKLLKAGIDGKTIEKLYLICNGIKIVHSPILFDILEIDIKENKRIATIRKHALPKEQYAVC